MTHSQAPVQATREKGSINVVDDIFVQDSVLEAAARLNLGNKKYTGEELTFFHLSQKTIGIINISEEPNW